MKPLKTIQGKNGAIMLRITILSIAELPNKRATGLINVLYRVSFVSGCTQSDVKVIHNPKARFVEWIRMWISRLVSLPAVTSDQ